MLGLYTLTLTLNYHMWTGGIQGLSIKMHACMHAFIHSLIDCVLVYGQEKKVTNPCQHLMAEKGKQSTKGGKKQLQLYSQHDMQSQTNPSMRTVHIKKQTCSATSLYPSFFNNRMTVLHHVNLFQMPTHALERISTTL